MRTTVGAFGDVVVVVVAAVAVAVPVAGDQDILFTIPKTKMYGGIFRWTGVVVVSRCYQLGAIHYWSFFGIL